MYASQILIERIPLNGVDSVATMMSKAVFGDTAKYGIQRPKEGPFAHKIKYGKYPILDVGTFHKIKSDHIQVLPGIRRIKGSNVVFENGKDHAYDVVVFATGFKRPTKQWLKGDDYMLNDDGFSQISFPNHWKGKNGIYCAGLAQKGLCGEPKI